MKNPNIVSYDNSMELKDVIRNVRALEDCFTPSKPVTRQDRVFTHDLNGGLHIYYVGQDQLND
jgi:hypothetical protein